MSAETLRSSFNVDGTRIFLIYDSEKQLYRLATRWYWLTSFETIYQACDAFEALELLSGDEKSLAKWLKVEVLRNPRSRQANPSAMTRINDLISNVERRMSGLRPQICGNKGSVVRWIPAASQTMEAQS